MENKHTFPPLNLGVKAIYKSTDNRPLDYKIYEGYIRFSNIKAQNNSNHIRFKATDGFNEKYTVLPFIYNKERDKFYKKDIQDNQELLSIDDFCWVIYNGSYRENTSIKKRRFENETERMLFDYIFNKMIIKQSPHKIFNKLRRFKENTHAITIADPSLDGFPYDFLKEMLKGHNSCAKSKTQNVTFYKGYFEVRIEPEEWGQKRFTPKYYKRGKKENDFCAPPSSYSLPKDIAERVSL